MTKSIKLTQIQNENNQKNYLRGKNLMGKNHDTNVSVIKDTVRHGQDWLLTDKVRSDELNERVESLLNYIDDGKEKPVRYSNSKEYLKHIDAVLEE